MLTRVLRYLITAGDPVTHSWMQNEFSQRPMACHCSKQLLALEFKTTTTELSGPKLLTLLENGDPEEAVPMLYQLLRLYEGDLLPFVDGFLTTLFYQRLKGKTKQKYQLPWGLFQYRVLTSMTDIEPLQPKPKINDLVIDDKKDHTRLILLPSLQLRGELHAKLRETESSYHGAN